MINKQLLFMSFLLFRLLVMQAQLDQGLVAAYYFSGNVKDNIGHIDGVAHGASLSTDRFGNAYAAYCFDGQDDYITLGTNRDLRQERMSISFWTKVNDFENNHFNYPGTPFISTRAVDLVEYYEAYVVSYENKGRRFIGSGVSRMQQQSTLLTDIKVELNKWYHLVYMFDADTMYLYVNGKLGGKNHKGFTTNYLVTDSVVLGYVGNHMPETFKYRDYAWFNGCLDDLKFYNRLLSPEEVLMLYREPNPKQMGKPDRSLELNLVDLFRNFWYVPCALVAIIILVVIIIRWRVNYFRRKEKENAELQQKFAQMEMKALRSQMNPHFIFNAINSIQHHVLTNEKELANKYLVKFSQLMRNILDLSKEEMISLKDELDTIQLYLDIESQRFNNAFSFALKIGEGISTKEIRLPPLIIQPFVENAIWHGLLLKENDKKLSITIYRQENNNVVIEIDDNGIGRDAAQKFSNKELKRRSFGMDITQDRLNILNKIYGIQISFEVIDKKDARGNALGTRVMFNIKL